MTERSRALRAPHPEYRRSLSEKDKLPEYFAQHRAMQSRSVFRRIAFALTHERIRANTFCR